MTTGQNRSMTAKEINDLVAKLHAAMNPVHREYNYNLESRNFKRAHDLCETLTTEEKKAVRYMLLCDKNIAMGYLRKHHKFVPDMEIAQDNSLILTIRDEVYEHDKGGKEDVIEKKVKKALLNTFQMI